MSQIDEYYWRIRSTYEDFEMHEQKAMPKRAFCGECHRVVPDWYPRQIGFRLCNIKRAVLVYAQLSVTCVYVYHTGLWRQIEHLCPNAVIGPVTIQHKDGVDRFTLDWVTILFPTSHLVHIRGSFDTENARRGGHSGVSHYTCNTCNQFAYWAANDLHLLRHRLHSDRPVFMNPFGDLIIAESVAQSLDWSGFPDLKYDRLPVLDRPLDGLRLPGDPDWSAMDA